MEVEMVAANTSAEDAWMPLQLMLQHTPNRFVPRLAVQRRVPLPVLDYEAGLITLSRLSR